MPRPAQPTALVTGGNRGIGLAIAKGLIAQGVSVTIGARTESEGRTAAQTLNCRTAHIDLLDPDTYFDAFTRSGGWDILVNNAGILNDVSLLDKGSDFANAMEVMVAAPLDLIRLNVPHWRVSGWGRVVNLSSGWGSHASGLTGPGAYAVAKASLNALTRDQRLRPWLGGHPHGRRLCPVQRGRGRRHANLARPSARRRPDRRLLPQTPARRLVNRESALRTRPGRFHTSPDPSVGYLVRARGKRRPPICPLPNYASRSVRPLSPRPGRSRE